MNCKRAAELFSELFEEGPKSPELVEVERHLKGCEPCRSGYAAFRYALEDLRALRLAPTDANHVSTVMAAVDAEAHARIRSPELTASRDGAIPRSANEAPARRPVLTHAVALLCGAAAMWLISLFLAPGLLGKATSTNLFEVAEAPACPASPCRAASRSGSRRWWTESSKSKFPSRFR